MLLTSHMEKYQVETQIAEGGGGWVFRAVDPDKGVKVALKKIKRDEKDKDGTWGMSVPALREIKFLQELRHENVIELMDVFKHDNFVYLVFPLMPSDLDKVIQTTPLTAGNIKAFMEMILEGVGFLHANWILHRDIKPDNFLVTNDSILKIMDLGLSKAYGTEPGTMHGRMTNAVATMGYKCPELLLGADSYGPAIDAWSCGCVFAEMMLRWAPSPLPPSLCPRLPACHEAGPLVNGSVVCPGRNARTTPVFAHRHNHRRRPFPGQGRSELDQLNCIAQTLGLPEPQHTGDAAGKIAAFPPLKPELAAGTTAVPPPPPLEDTFGAYGPEAVALLRKLLALDPAERLEAAAGAAGAGGLRASLHHAYFLNYPRPEKPQLKRR